MLDNKLEAILAVAEEKNFTRAAKKLSLTQPAVSQIVRKMEAELGVPLFIRKNGDIVPTQQGEIVLSYARRFEAMYEKMQRDILDAEKHINNIRVGITHTAESNIVTEILGKFTSQNPGFSITVITDTIKNLYTKLENYELDLAIVEGKPQNPNLYSLMLDTDYLVCVVAPTHPLARQSMATLNELKKEQMILRLPTSATRMLFESTLESINESIENFNVILEVDNIATIKDLVRKGLGISILAKSTCMDELKKGKICVMPIENLSMIRETNIVYNKYFSHIAPLKEIVKTYREEVAKLYT